jgi:hypothetical protein
MAQRNDAEQRRRAHGYHRRVCPLRHLSGVTIRRKKEGKKEKIKKLRQSRRAL